MKLQLQSKIRRSLPIAALAFGLLLISSASWGQEHKKDSAKVRKNIIRFNLSNCLLFGGQNLIFGYERVVSPHQSFSFNIGKASLPRLVSIDTDSTKIKRQAERTGLNVSADYRFYLKRENKYGAPRGVYIGPYLMYTKMKAKTIWEIESDNGPNQIDMGTEFSVLGGGVELGYQFIIKKRFTLDLVLIGPGIANYSLKAKFDGTVSLEEKEQLVQALQQALQNKYPGMDLVFGEKEISSDGNLGVLSAGFRYLIHIGYSF